MNPKFEQSSICKLNTLLFKHQWIHWQLKQCLHRCFTGIVVQEGLEPNLPLHQHYMADHFLSSTARALLHHDFDHMSNAQQLKQ